MGESVRARIKQYTKAELASMSGQDIEKHVAHIMQAVKQEKAAGRTKDLGYLYKALPGKWKTDEMKRRILPFDMKDYKKKVPPPKKIGQK